MFGLPCDHCEDCEHLKREQARRDAATKEILARGPIHDRSVSFETKIVHTDYTREIAARLAKLHQSPA